MLYTEVCDCYSKVCNFVSEYVYENYDELTLPSPFELQKVLYKTVRSNFPLKSQMTISTFRTVVGRYRALIAKIKRSQEDYEWWLKRKKEKELKGLTFKRKEPYIYKWKQIQFKLPQCDQVSDRDWSFVEHGKRISINTLNGRIKLFYSDKGFEKYRGCTHGSAKLVIRKGKAFLYVSVAVPVPDVDFCKVTNVVGIDSGIRFLTVSYDGDKTMFTKGGEVKDRRLHYKEKRTELQKRNTRSSKRRLNLIGKRENRWMNDYLHCLSKTLVNQYPVNTVFALEDLSGIREKLQDIRLADKSYYISWPYGKFIQFLSYKAERKGQKVILVNPYQTSQCCPVCGKVSSSFRNYKIHEFRCSCGYISNDDRVASMNIRKKGILEINKRKRAIDISYSSRAESASL